MQTLAKQKPELRSGFASGGFAGATSSDHVKTSWHPTNDHTKTAVTSAHRNIIQFLCAVPFGIFIVHLAEAAATTASAA
jgi:hypothetical protein